MRHGPATISASTTCCRPTCTWAADIFSSKTNNIVTRHITHLFVLGVTTESITIGRSRGIDPHARIISAIY